jgi:O-antigen/teichoic acid export membrane protein
VLYLRPHCPLPRYDQFRFSLFCDLVRKGFPIMALTLTDMLLCTSDRLILSCYVDPEHLGYYGIAITATTFVMQVPRASREVIEPCMMESLGMGLHGESLERYLSTPLVLTSLFMPRLVGLMIFFVAVLTPAFLPRYTPGIVPSQILLCGTQFLALAYLLRGVIIANDWQLTAAGIMALVLLVNVILSVLLLHAGWGISGVAMGTAMSFLLLFVVLFSLVAARSKQLRYDWKRDGRLLLLTIPALTVANAVPVYLSTYSGIHALLGATEGLAILFIVWFGVWSIGRHLHPALAKTSLRQLVMGIRS